jgi:hypothetical protein
MEIDINGAKFSTGKLNAMQQFHVARRLAPILLAFGSAAGAAVKQLDNSGSISGDIALLGEMGPVAEAIAQMSDIDSEYVLSNCLSVCQRQDGAAWQKVYQMNGGFLYPMEIDVMMRLTATVIKENLGNFFSALLVN